MLHIIIRYVEELGLEKVVFVRNKKQSRKDVTNSDVNVYKYNLSCGAVYL